MTATVEGENVRPYGKDKDKRSRLGERNGGLSDSPSDKREVKTSHRFGPSSGRHKLDRVSPENPHRMSRREKGGAQNRTSRGRSGKMSRRKLKVDTSLDCNGDNDGSTPKTTASTPASAEATIRSDGDLRSPGYRKSPTFLKSKLKMAGEDAPIPDLITQTDRNGNAITPRSNKAIETARAINPNGAKPNLHVGKDGKLHEDGDDENIEELDACAESFMDSIRLMCCCLMPEENPAAAQSKPQVTTAATMKEEDIPAELERPKLLPEIHPDDHGKKCLVLDLDETLVHSSFRAVAGADFVIPVQIEDVVHFVYVMKRPGVDLFLESMAKHYEVVVYTASLNKYADPLLDLLDTKKSIRSRLFRESCVYYEGNYVKDLSLLDRDLSQAIIVDNSPSSFIFHPENAIDCSSFIDDPSDRELDQIAAFLTGVRDVKDVREYCHLWRDWPKGKVAESQ